MYFSSLFTAFPGILNWQHRIWLCLNEFNKIRNDATIQAPDANDTNYQDEELKLFELRNSSVARAEHNYVNANFSTAIKMCQELTDELRVKLHWNFFSETLSFTKHFFFYNFSVISTEFS